MCVCMYTIFSLLIQHLYHFSYSSQVVHLVTSEFFHQGDMEREKLQVEPQVSSEQLFSSEHSLRLTENDSKISLLAKNMCKEWKHDLLPIHFQQFHLRNYYKLAYLTIEFNKWIILVCCVVHKQVNELGGDPLMLQ